MKYYPIISLFTIIMVGVTGCTQFGTPAPTLADNQTVSPVPGGNGTLTGSPTPGGTLDRALVPMVPYKDTRLRIAFYIPEDWSVSTHQVQKPAGAEGLTYQTDLLGDSRFNIITYTISRNEDQAYRNEIRPARRTFRMLCGRAAQMNWGTPVCFPSQQRGATLMS
jgi:hypothetical protein